MKKVLIVVISAILLISAVFIYRLSKYYSVSCEEYADNGLRGELTHRINSSVVDSLQSENRSYEELTEIIYLPDGRIGTIKADALKINKIALGISEAVYDSIKDPETEYGVPLGNAIGSRFFAGKGPKIPVRLTQINAVSYEIKSDLISGGINQTVHRISVRYTVTVKCLAPFNENLIIINGEQIIAETVIIGEVPEILLRETG